MTSGIGRLLGLLVHQICTLETLLSLSLLVSVDSRNAHGEVQGPFPEKLHIFSSPFLWQYLEFNRIRNQMWLFSRINNGVTDWEFYNCIWLLPTRCRPSFISLVGDKQDRRRNLSAVVPWRLLYATVPLSRLVASFSLLLPSFSFGWKFENLVKHQIIGWKSIWNQGKYSAKEQQQISWDENPLPLSQTVTYPEDVLPLFPVWGCVCMMGFAFGSGGLTSNPA